MTKRVRKVNRIAVLLLALLLLASMTACGSRAAGGDLIPEPDTQQSAPSGETGAGVNKAGDEDGEEAGGHAASGETKTELSGEDLPEDPDETEEESGGEETEELSEDEEIEISDEEMSEDVSGFGLGGVQPEAEAEEPLVSSAIDGWTICWYVCGSNLESYYGCASDDLAEAAAAVLPQNVRIVIQTGGSYKWHNELVSSGAIERHVLDSTGFRTVQELPDADMGSASTLSSFLSFCREYYPSTHKAVIFWNHGGGSVAGAEFDETHGFDALTINEFISAFSGTYGISEAAPAFDLVGFDACLMATVDVASAFRGIGRYLVASEELEPGCGWYYTGWLNELAANPYMDGAALGRAICDTYVQGCSAAGTGSKITLSLTDIGKLGGLISAYNAFGNEALLAALDSPDFYAEFGRRASMSESYGGNTPEQGYTNMVDLGHLVRNSSGILPETSQAVLDALAGCVLYRVSGPYRAESTGLSCYYSYSGDINNFVGYTAVGVSEPFKYLYAYGLAGRLSEAGEDYVRAISPEAAEVTPMRELPAMDDFDLSQVITAYVDEEGFPVLEVDPVFSSILREVHVRVRQAYLAGTDPVRIDVVAWGESDLVGRDWENGIFRAYFDGYWAALDGSALYLEVEYSGEGYTLYSSPILLNGTLCNLHIAYEEKVEELEGGASMTYADWHILGATEGIDPDTGMADKNLVLLQPGDEIIPVYLVMQNVGGEGAQWEHYCQPENAVIYCDEYDLEMFADFGHAVYDIEFELVDCRNQKTYSDRFAVQVWDYDMSVQLWDDYMEETGGEVYRFR